MQTFILILAILNAALLLALIYKVGKLDLNNTDQHRELFCGQAKSQSQLDMKEYLKRIYDVVCPGTPQKKPPLKVSKTSKSKPAPKRKKKLPKKKA
jgi:hypothetical protein